MVILERERHEKLINDVRATGARIKLISDGDLTAGINVAVSGTGVHAVMGIGGAPEAVVAACAIRCIGGQIQCKLWPRDEQEWAAVKDAGIDVSRVLRAEDLVDGEDIFFAATGISDGELLRLVRSDDAPPPF